MMRKLFGGAGILAMPLLLIAGVWADEEKIALDKVPKAVLDAAKAKFPGAELKGASKETDGGKVEYEIELTYKGYNHDVTFTPAGKLIAIEKTIPAKELPKAVAAAVESKYPKAKIKQAEEITKDGKVTYEVHLVTAQSSAVEVVLDPAGKVLKEEVQKEKKKG